MRTRRKQSDGFTLIELILVLIVITIIIALVAPSLSGFTVGRRNKDMASLFINLASYARTQSVAEGRVYRLNVDPKTGAMWLTAGKGGIFGPPSSDFGDRFESPQDIRVQSELPQHEDATYVEFQPSGRCEAGRIRFIDKLGGMIEVVCESSTELYHVVGSPGTENH